MLVRNKTNHTCSWLIFIIHIYTAGQSQLPAAAAATITSSQTSMSTSQDPNDPQRGGRGRRRIASALFPVKNAIVEEQAVVPIAHLEGHRGSVTDLAYNHQGDRILSG